MGVEYIIISDYMVICWINTAVCLQFCYMLYWVCGKTYRNSDYIFFMGNLFNVYSNYYFLRIIIRGGKNHMNRKSAIISILAILIVLSTATISNAISIKQQPIKELISETVNHQVYLGSASIIGNGNSSTLEAVAKNDKINAK